MRTSSACFPLVATLALGAAVVQASVGQTPRGVSPANAKFYVPDSNGQWRCLDGQKTIPFSAVNDDYCDCKDGSDEPGTSACGTGYFYCANVGHVGSSIKTSRVNDGVCDPECCDGTDEYDGQIHCPNICETVGAEAKKEQERIRAIQEKGSLLRKEYIEYGKTTKTELQKEIEELKSKTDTLQKAVTDTKEKLDKANEILEKHLEGTKNEREAARKIQLAPLIEEQGRRLKHAQETRDFLFKNLQDLKENYNKNYHDLAVKNAVSAFDEFVTSLGEDSKFEPTFSGDGSDSSVSADEQLKTLTDDTNILQREIGSLYDILAGMKREYNTEYNDEAVLLAVKATEDFELNWDSETQEFKNEPVLDIPDEESDDDPESEKLREVTDRAQADYDAASNEGSNIKDRISDIERKLQVDFGPDETFAKLFDQCFDFKDSEYTYSLCFFGDANQRSQSTTFLGKFSDWGNGNEKYNTQWYTGGTKCWNGPDRSVKVELTCGEFNEITSVAEPAKCEYLFKMQTPAACPLLPDSDKSVPEEDRREATKHDEL
ncbi:hypothetical protein BGZ49_002060 [Haplosporangium sp. Z 27]|nr:hypothetical protein BGZ49_002060 [Haplosporangium sp. Z 27]